MRSALAFLVCFPACIAAQSAAARPAAPDACIARYGYAGVIGAHPAAGVSAHVAALRAPVVRFGHVAAWVGLSPGVGGDGSWIQAGIAGFEGGQSALYYEVGRPGSAPTYRPVRYGVRPAESHDVAVREVAGAPGTWRVWIDGRPVSPAIALPASHDAWKPMVMAESWNGGTGACNAFRFSFSDLRSTRSARSAWTAFAAAPRLVDPGYRLVGDDARLLASTR